jgi:hypothetical protein
MVLANTEERLLQVVLNFQKLHNLLPVTAIHGNEQNIQLIIQ